MTVLFPIVLFGWLAGHLEVGEANDRNGPATPNVDSRLFDFPQQRFSFELEQKLDAPAYTVSALRFPTPLNSPDPVNNTVHAEYFQPRGEGARAGVVVLHILGADFALSRYLAARLADQGVAALFVKLPYYGERRAQDDARFLSNNLPRSVFAMRQAVCDIRRAASWLQSRPEIDPKRLGITGISLGGILSALSAGVDSRFSQAALLLAGGNLAEILWTMPEARRYRSAWIAMGGTKATLAAITRPYDPLRFAPNLQGRDILMIAGRVDEVVPPACTEELWRSAGRPPLIWYDCGHYSAVGYLLPAIRQTVNFFTTKASERVRSPEVGGTAGPESRPTPPSQ